MRRKRHYDLREFWPWVERWPVYLRTRGLIGGVRPPFELSDISTKQHKPVSPRMERFLLIVRLTLAAVAVGGFLWVLFFVR